MIYKVLIRTKKDNGYNWETKYFKLRENGYKEICKAVELDNFAGAWIEPIAKNIED